MPAWNSFFRLDDDPVPVSFRHNGYLLCGSEKSVPLFEENYITQTYEFFSIEIV